MQRRCIGYGIFRGVCPNAVDPRRGTLFCGRCESLRDAQGSQGAGGGIGDKFLEIRHDDER